MTPNGAAVADGIAALGRWGRGGRFLRRAGGGLAPRRRWSWPTISPQSSRPATSPGCGPLHDQLLRRAAAPEATVFRGGRKRTDRYSAAVANGAAAGWCELDEGYRAVPCHGGLCVLPALWAEAEAEGRTVRELLRALAIGYERWSPASPAGSGFPIRGFTPTRRSRPSGPPPASRRFAG